MSKLDKYLDNLFEQVLEFQIPAEEVTFIKTGVGKIALDIANIVFQYPYAKGVIGILKTVLEKDFSGSGINFEEIPSGNSLIKAGSSAENTRNRFPDEFDFVLVVGTYKITQSNDTFYESYWSPIRQFEPIYTTIIEILNKENLRRNLIYLDKSSDREIKFSSLSSNLTSFQPVTFNLMYTNNGLPSHEISVDLIPAVRVFDDALGDRSGLCGLPEFNEVVVKSGRYLLTRTSFSITESEVYFMTNVLSSNHKKVYRILKYLINGHSGDGELRRVISRHVSLLVFIKTLMISTYRIKTALIFHHCNCFNLDASVGSCLLQMLLTLKKCFETRQWPHLLNRWHMEYPGSVPRFRNSKYTESTDTILKTGAHVLAEMIEILQAMEIDHKGPIGSVEPWVRSVTREIVLRNLSTEKSCTVL